MSQRRVTVSTMSFDQPLPAALSPSRLKDFQECPRRFQYSNVERLRQPATVATTKGNVVHHILEHLFHLPPASRSHDAALSLREAAFAHEVTEDIQADIDWASCEAQMRLDVDAILETYFEMEDPSSIEAIGVERNIAATINDAPLRGILDRLDQNDDGSITIVDYKTGKPPRAGYENDALANSQIYAALCEAEIGQLPTNIRLLYVAHGSTLDVAVSPVVVSARAKSAATVWQRINTFYADGEFPADPSPRTCRWCAYKDVCRERGVPVPV